MMYRHGLRVSEVIGLKKADINLRESRIWMQRLRGGTFSGASYRRG